MKDHHHVIKTVLLSEKATDQTELMNKYYFKVDPKSNKIEIKNAVEELFNVKVASVNTVNYKGKRKRMRTAQKGKRADWKKAVVTLKDGESIDVF